jgi:hypothetical protein
MEEGELDNETREGEEGLDPEEAVSFNISNILGC